VGVVCWFVFVWASRVFPSCCLLLGFLWVGLVFSFAFCWLSTVASRPWLWRFCWFLGDFDCVVGFFAYGVCGCFFVVVFLVVVRGGWVVFVVLIVVRWLFVLFCVWVGVLRVSWLGLVCRLGLVGLVCVVFLFVWYERVFFAGFEGLLRCVLGGFLLGWVELFRRITRFIVIWAGWSGVRFVCLGGVHSLMLDRWLVLGVVYCTFFFFWSYSACL